MARIFGSSRRGRTGGRGRRPRPLAEVLEGRLLLATITVTSNGDADGADGSDTLSLRQAIEISDGMLSVSKLTPAQQALVVGSQDDFPNTIDFDIPGAGPFTIAPATTLPTIIVPTVIDGYSQPGATPNTNGPGLGDNAVLKIELNGSNLNIGNTAPFGYGSGLIATFDATIKGLAIDGFNGVDPTTGTIFGGGVTFVGGNDQLQGCFIGAGIDGETASGNAGAGVIGYNEAATIGGTTPAARNVISGNAVNIDGGGFVVEGSFIGTDAAGTKALITPAAAPNGVGISSPSDLIGGTAAGAGNVISGNRVGIQGGGTVLGNLIGTDVTGTKAIGNTDYGIYVGTPPVFDVIPQAGTFVNMDVGVTTVNGSPVTVGNVIAGSQVGVSVQNYKIVNILPLPHPGEFVPSNQASGIEESANIEGNLIGTDITGTKALANVVGIQVVNFGSATIGGSATGAGNVISGNVQNGLEADQTTSGLLIQGNKVGTDVTGTQPLGNGGLGVFLAGQKNTVGGSVAGAGNIISANAGDGLDIVPQPFSFADNFKSDALFPATPLPLTGLDLVQGNIIGTDVTRSTLPNNGNGILVAGSDNTIGGTTAGTGNTIAFNNGAGVAVINYVDNTLNPPGIVAGSGLQNFISGNSIFGNTSLGIELTGNANNLQPSPVLSPTAVGSLVSGTLDAAPSTSYTIELFSIDDASDVILNQNQVYLGLTLVTTDAAGHASFTFAVPAGQSITATASDPAGNTSAFSAPITSTGSVTPLIGSTTTTLIGPSSSSTFGQGVPLAAVVTTTPGITPTGMVLFGSAGVILGEAPVNAQGVALLYTNLLPPGVDVVAAAYLGDASTGASLSNYVAINVTPEPPSVALAGPSAATRAGQPVTLTATVEPAIRGGAKPTGMVEFGEGGVIFGEATVDASGRAVFVTKSLPVGSDVVSAVYLGDASSPASLSNYVAVDITPKATKSSVTVKTKAKAVKATSVGKPVATHPVGPNQAAKASKTL